MKVFVTGATGFIGSYLVKELLRQGHDLLCLKRSSSDLYRLGDASKQVTWVNTTDDWMAAFKTFQPEAVFNLAWDGVSSKDRVIWSKQVGNIALQQTLLDLCVAFVPSARSMASSGTGSESSPFSVLMRPTVG